MRTGIGPVIKNHVTFQVHWIASAVCHRVCCLTSSVTPGKQDQDQPTFLVRAKAACLSWPQYMLPPGLREWILHFQYFLMLIQKTSKLVGALPREWLWLPVAWGQEGLREGDTWHGSRCTRGCTNAKRRSVVFTEVMVLLVWCNSEFRNRDEASPKSVPLRQ